mmetsp:Transcript_67536/g.180497  ORF Transcript_67536/g.180497 Transcript_67536/m.180497 type:complete len:170 (+) Transcript_67536:53-562(+)
MDERGESMTDTGPLVKLKEAMKRVKKDIRVRARPLLPRSMCCRVPPHCSRTQSRLSPSPRVAAAALNSRLPFLVILTCSPTSHSSARSSQIWARSSQLSCLAARSPSIMASCALMPDSVSLSRVHTAPPSSPQHLPLISLSSSSPPPPPLSFSCSFSPLCLTSLVYVSS